jgi:phospholipase C
MRRRDFLKLSASCAIATATASQPVGAQTALAKIKHIVVLMLENRSFDSMLGRLYPKSNKFDGLLGTESNPDLAGAPILVNNQTGTSADAMATPDPNPGESWRDINEQLFGSPEPPSPGQVPTMNGFVRNYQKQKKKPAERYVAERIMNHFTPEQVPVISQLARQFAVSDRWFASAPCQTWPNRFFLHTGTANGYENNFPLHFPYRMPTIFERLQAMDPDNGWRIYFHDIAHATTLANLWHIRGHFLRYARFKEDARNGALPAYAFIEPDYLPYLGPQNDAHPPTSAAMGEQLLADVYNTLRQGPAWISTLLIVIFDEHGGLYDHVPPPPAVPPSRQPTAPFNFDRYGIRVPAVIVSPYIEKGLVLRPPGQTPFDHTSVIATLRKRYALGPPLTARDAAAPDLEAALTLSEPTNMGPERIEALPVERMARAAAAAAEEPPSDLQASLLELSRNLPTEGDDVSAHIRRLESAVPAPRAAPPESTPPLAAGEIVDLNVKRFLGEK